MFSARSRTRSRAITAAMGRYAKLYHWVEEDIEETFIFYRRLREHHKHLKSTNLLGRLNDGLKRRTLVVRI